MRSCSSRTERFVFCQVESSASGFLTSTVSGVGTSGALLFSRAPIPLQRDAEPTAADLASGAFLRHLGIYVYTADALTRWVALPEGRLERIERLEQLRPLAAGLRIGVAVVDPIEGGVDTPADVVTAERRLLAEARDASGIRTSRYETAR